MRAPVFAKRKQAASGPDTESGTSNEDASGVSSVRGAKSAWLPSWIRHADLVSEEGGTVLGAVITLVATVAFVGYAVAVIYSFATTPTKANVEIRWSANQGIIEAGPSFPVALRCEAKQGCTVAVKYSDRTMASDSCRRALKAAGWETNECRKYAQGEELPETYLCFSDIPGDGIYVGHDGGDRFGVGVLSVSEAPLKAKYMPLHVGRTSLMFVQTMNETYAEGALGYDRREWFPTLLSTEVISDAVPNCISQRRTHTQLEVASQWFHISAQVWALEMLGEIGGFWSFVFELGFFLFLGAWTVRKAVRMCLRRRRPSESKPPP